MSRSTSASPTSNHSSDDWEDFVSVNPTPISNFSTKPSHPSPQPPSSSVHNSTTVNVMSNSLSPSSSTTNTNTNTTTNTAKTEAETENVTPNSTAETTTNNEPLQGFDTLDAVQRYALGALAVVLLHRHATDLNGTAFARTQSLVILDALKLRPGQQEAILALDPSESTRDAVVTQCVNLVGDIPHRFRALQAMLALSVVSGTYDARSRAFLATVSLHFGITWPAIAAVELAVAAHLFQEHEQISQQQQTDLTDSAENTKSNTRIDVDKQIEPYISIEETNNTNQLPLSNGNPFATTMTTYEQNEVDHDSNSTMVTTTTNETTNNDDTLSTTNAINEKNNNTTVATTSTMAKSSSKQPPSVDQLLTQRRKKKQRVRKAMKIGGITLVGGVLFGLTGGLIAPALLSALAGVGVASAAGLAASGSLASGAVVGGLFGVAGGGFTLRKARNRVSTNLDEFDFERPDDQRVIAARKRKAERERRKAEKRALQQQQQQEKIENEQRLAIEDKPRDDDTDDASNQSPSSTSRNDSSSPGARPRQGTNEKQDDKNSEAKPKDKDFLEPVDTEKELPRPPERTSDDDDDIYDDDDETIYGDDDIDTNETYLDDDNSSRGDAGKKSHAPFGKRRKKKYEKVKVGASGLKAVADVPSLHLCICVPAWLAGREYGAALEQFERALEVELPCSQHIAVRWESRRLYEMGLAFAKFWASKATVTTIQQTYPHAVAAASTVAGALAFAFAIPLTVMSCMDYIDNPWSILVSRSNGAGEELADVLVERSYGRRPVTLFGYSIGARVIFKCLECLASRKAHGIVENVLLVGAPITAEPERWRRIRSVVAGRIVNAYGSYDWALAFFHRGCGHGVYVSGLRKVEEPGIENLNLAYLGIEGHRELKDSVPRAMHAMGMGLGYITMPPAKLVVKGHSTGIIGGHKEETVVCEEPGGAEWARDPEAENSVGNYHTRTEAELVDQDMNVVGHETREGDVENVTSTTWTSSVSDLANGDVSPEENSQTKENERSNKGVKKGKAKPKKWPSLSGWYWKRPKSSSSDDRNSTSKSKQSESTDSSKHEPINRNENLVDNYHNTNNSKGNPFIDAEESDREVRDVIKSVDMEDMEPADQGTNSTAVVAKNPFIEDDYETIENKNEPVSKTINPRDVDESVKPNDIGSSTTGSVNNEQAFDWERQRKIWEEQERQLKERGYADSAQLIEMSNRLMLPISVEVAGRRLEQFLEQDGKFPVKRSEEVFTNCVDNQRGMHIRVYEHEPSVKSVATNMLRWTKRYPKLLACLEVRLRESAVKGRLRVRVAIWADTSGNIHAMAQEEENNGKGLNNTAADKIGEPVTAIIPKSELCTAAERIELEVAAEQRNKLMEVPLALPSTESAPVSASAGASATQPVPTITAGENDDEKSESASVADNSFAAVPSSSPTTVSGQNSDNDQR